MDLNFAAYWYSSSSVDYDSRFFLESVNFISQLDFMESWEKGIFMHIQW